ncbi:MAG: DNA alkylation repair protein [Actinomycetota bacterium]
MAEAMKDGFDRDLVVRIARATAELRRGFDHPAFVDTVMAELPALELKDRVSLMADALVEGLGGEYLELLPTVVEVASAVAGDPDGGDAWGTSMEAWPLCSVVERHGLDHPTESLAAMAHLTRSFSCEFAIRPFLNTHLDETLAACRGWTRSPIAAVRRLASEGTRPYLPWGAGVRALVAHPEIGIELVSGLRHDPDEVVRRSVANHLNDIARKHPDRVAELASEWLADPTIEPSMVRHALRGLIKRGHPGAMAALGFATDATVEVDRFVVTPGELSLGASIALDATLTSTASEPRRFVVDFVIHHIGARGETSPKVFKWATVELEPGETISLHKARRIQTASTRRYHAGRHRTDLQVAGQILATDGFELLDSST